MRLRLAGIDDNSRPPTVVVRGAETDELSLRARISRRKSRQDLVLTAVHRGAFFVGLVTPAAEMQHPMNGDEEDFVFERPAFVGRLFDCPVDRNDDVAGNGAIQTVVGERHHISDRIIAEMLAMQLCQMPIGCQH